MAKAWYVCVTKVACDDTSDPYTVSRAHEDTSEDAQEEQNCDILWNI